MSNRLKNTLIIAADAVLAVYLLRAITAFNRPDEIGDVCNEVKIDIKDAVVKGFLNADEVKAQLQRAKIYPLGDRMSDVSTRRIEETLRQNPLVESAECYKTQTGRVFITLTQRIPVIRVMADNGDNYYVDNHGGIMPPTRYASSLVVATGHISKPYAQKVLRPIGSMLLKDNLWRNQVEQLNVLSDGSLELIPRIGEHIVYLGQPTGLEKKLARLEKFYRYGLSKAGWNKYSYISVEFDNQIICKKTRRY